MSLDIDLLTRRYCEALSSPDLPIMEKIQRSTHLNTPKPQDASDPIQGRLLGLLSQILSPQLILEIGTMSAYATIHLAQGLRDGGRLISIEANTDLAPLITQHLEWSQLQDRIEIQYGQALDIIPTINERIDILYMDAAKRQYRQYFDMLLHQINRGGLIIADNVLWKGEVTHSHQSTMARSLDEFNRYVRSRPEVEILILPYRDGLSIMRKITD